MRFPSQIIIENEIKDIFEELIYADTKNNQLINSVFKNPTRKELKNNQSSMYRYCYDKKGNFYFGSAEEYIHESLKMIVEKIYHIKTKDEEGFYNVNENCFYFRDDYYTDVDVIEDYLKSKPILQQNFGDFKVKIFNN